MLKMFGAKKKSIIVLTFQSTSSYKFNESIKRRESIILCNYKMNWDKQAEFKAIVVIFENFK